VALCIKNAIKETVKFSKPMRWVSRYVYLKEGSKVATRQEVTDLVIHLKMPNNHYLVDTWHYNTTG